MSNKLKEMFEAGTCDKLIVLPIKLMGKSHDVTMAVSIHTEVLSVFVETEYDALLVSHYYSSARNVKIDRCGGDKDLILVSVLIK